MSTYLAMTLCMQVVACGTYVYLTLTERRVWAALGFLWLSALAVSMAMRRITSTLDPTPDVHAIDHFLIPFANSILIVLACSCHLADRLHERKKRKP